MTLDAVVDEAINEGREKGMTIEQIAELIMARVNAEPSLERELKLSMIKAVLDGQWKTEVRPGVTSFAAHKFASAVVASVRKYWGG